MSLRYRNGSGEETVISGLTPGGDIESGAVATRSGSFNITFNGSATSEGNVAVTFDQPMPDADYDVSFSYNGQWTGVSLYANQKTANGFNVCYANIVSSTATRTYNYRAIKTYTVQHAAQNAESIANLEAMVPTGAGSGNKLVTASQLTNTTSPIATDVANLTDLVPVGASITNQLVTKSEASVDSALSSTSEHAVQNKVVKAALDAKQDTLTFDNVPTTGSSNPVKSNGIYDTATDIYEVMGKNGAKNLLPNITVPQTISGITYTKNSNGSVTINGTSTGWGQNDVGKCLLTKGTYTISVGVTVPVGVFFTLRNDDTDSSILNLGNGSTETKRSFTLASDTNIRLYCGISGNVAVSNITFYPMVYLAEDTDSTYQPYAETNYQLTQDKMSYADNGILGAKNFLPNNGSDSLTTTGITFTKNADGTVTINGTATAYTLYNLFVNNASFVVENKNGLIVSALQNGVTLRVKDSDETWYGSSTREVIVPAGKNIVAGSIAINNGTTLNNYTVGPMLRCISDTDPTYQPYAMTNRELTEKVNTHTILTNNASSVALDTSSTMYTSVTLTPGTWYLLGRGQGVNTITSNSQRCELKFQSSTSGAPAFHALAAIPHNTPYPPVTWNDIVTVTKDTVVGISAYADSGGYTLGTLFMKAVKLL